VLEIWKKKQLEGEGERTNAALDKTRGEISMGEKWWMGGQK